MATEKMIKALNNQLFREFQSEYIYISMEAYFASQNLDGFANFFNVQAQEERAHAYKIFNYIHRIGGKVELQSIPQPKIDFESPKEVIQLALEHEKFITKSIHDILALAIEEKDYTTSAFLQWYINEQAEEEESMEKILNKIKLLKEDPAGILMLDSELAKRVFVPIPTE
ncbi:ferritin [Alkalithermobacter thermoalcaliphilus JW-YL-7 = DSM 7308]|uniref:Ferritin n=1 Tax=Alkalithermobacter thermoalcaliphilus JW-YL-7 = DSM 7308 TaxID=1121328 RepID=A0A150FSS9_CLOPD|nr:Ferroxidase [[Clostridium] paradoxum JW-YL-7 = DSM 7308]SHL18505.1 ferritin [[Clostridium] paradoxum JW-YL-7 = DSM 7308]